MNSSIKAGLLTLAIGTMFAAADSNAALVPYGSAANAPGRCQAFTPGPANTIRNRVVGSENIGTPIAVVCDFEAGVSETSTNVLEVSLWFSNNGTSGPFTVNCSMLNGWQGASGAVIVNKSVSVTAGTQSEIAYNSDDTPAPGDSDLGFSVVGVNCTLPTNAVINDTYVWWGDEDGVGV